MAGMVRRSGEYEVAGLPGHLLLPSYLNQHWRLSLMTVARPVADNRIAVGQAFDMSCSRFLAGRNTETSNNGMSAENNDKLEFIFGRRSIRNYAPGDISEALVTKLLQAAMAAPSAGAKDPWRFVVIREKETLMAIAAALPFGKMLPTASLGMVVCGELDAHRPQGNIPPDCRRNRDLLMVYRRLASVVISSIRCGPTWLSGRDH